MKEDDVLKVSIRPINSSDEMDIDSFSVKKGEEFKTDPNYHSWVVNDDGKYNLVVKDSHGSFRLLGNTIHIVLEPGNYLFS